MKKHALSVLVATLGLTSCMYPPHPPMAGPRGYPLDRGPGERRYGAEEQPPGPRDTRYSETNESIPGDQTSANVQAPDPNAPISSETVTKPADAAANGTAPANPIVVAPDKKPITPTPTETPRATRTKTGHVKSPFDPLGREIDVRDMRSGQKARCPYTQKVFIVP